MCKNDEVLDALILDSVGEETFKIYKDLIYNDEDLFKGFTETVLPPEYDE